jgi:hypothetical protein
MQEEEFSSVGDVCAAIVPNEKQLRLHLQVHVHEGCWPEFVRVAQFPLGLCLYNSAMPVLASPPSLALCFSFSRYHE